MKQKILIIVDAQNDFITGKLGSDEANVAVEKICDLIENEHWDIIFTTKDTHYTDPKLCEGYKIYKKTNEYKHLPVEHCIKYSEGWQLDQRIQNKLNSVTSIVKTVYKNKFGSIELVSEIAKMFAKETDLTDAFDITLVGFCTDICVVSNAILLKSAYESEIYVKADCCAGTTVENHEAALKTMKSCHINII